MRPECVVPEYQCAMKRESKKQVPQQPTAQVSSPAIINQPQRNGDGSNGSNGASSQPQAIIDEVADEKPNIMALNMAVRQVRKLVE